MKRKFSRSSSIDPSPSRSSENQFDAAKGNEAKTSEYAFFKKLKTDASHMFHSRPPHQFKIRDSPRERSSGVKSSTKELRLPVEDVTRVRGDVFLSPVDLKRDSKTCEDICGTSTRRSMEEYNNSMRPMGTQTQHQDLFSAKRQKLHQLVADISFPGIEELCSKGYDFVSVLLSRLLPESNKNNNFKIPRSAQVQSDAKSKFLASPSSNLHSKNHHQMSTRNFMDVECDPYSDNYSSACWLGRSRERTLSNFDSLIDHTYNALPEFNSSELSYKLGGERNAIAWIERDSSFSFPFEKYGYYSSSHLGELDDLHYPDASLLQRKEHALLPGLASKNVTNERTSSVISQNTELITYPVSSLTPWSDSREWSTDDGFGPLRGSGLCASPLICKHPSSFYSLPPPDLATYFKDEFGRHYIKDKEDIAADYHCPFTLSHRPSFGRHYIEDKEKVAADLNYSPLTLSRRPSYLTMIEDSDQETTFDASLSFLSPGKHHWFLSKFPNERHHDHETESPLSPKLDFDLGRKCLSICDSSSKYYASIYPAIEFPGEEHVYSRFLNIDQYEDCLDGLSHRGVPHHFSNDIVNIQDWSSFYFQISLDRKKACPLLLDNSSWEISEGETYHS